MSGPTASGNPRGAARRWWWSLMFVVLSVPLAINLLQNWRKPADERLEVVRFATFNCALQRAEPGAMLAELRSGSAAARAVAEIVQRCEVDVLLLCELDRDAAGEAARVFAQQYLAVSQNGQPAIDFPFVWCAESNTGEPSGVDLDGDGRDDGPGDAFGYGAFPGQYAMALLSRYPIRSEAVRTFRQTKWRTMPDALLPPGLPDVATSALRLSSKSHWDVPIQLDAEGMTVHVLASHPTPPVFDGPEDRNGRRNHDEIRFWLDYLDPARAGWIVDDQGGNGGLPAAAHFVILGDLNCDPEDGDARREALRALLAHARVQDPQPRSSGGEQASVRQWGLNPGHRGAAELDTGDFGDEAGKGPGSGPGNLRVDYVLPSRSLRIADSEVFWPAAGAAAALVEVSDHRLVWADVVVRAVRR